MTENRFDEAAATWDEHPRRMALTRAIAEAVEARIPLSKDTTMLDFGCGTAALSVLLAGRVGRILAVDTSSGMIAEVRRKLVAQAELASVIEPSLLAGGADGPPEGQWDLVCTAMALHHIDDAMGTLRHLAGCVNPGGHLAVADLYAEHGSFHGEERVPHNGFDPGALAEVLTEAGLDVAATETVLSFDKPCDDGQTREFSVFLLIARKP